MRSPLARWACRSAASPCTSWVATPRSNETRRLPGVISWCRWPARWFRWRPPDWRMSRPGRLTEPVAEFLLLELAGANLLVGVFNLLPALPLDGGHMLRAAVWRVTAKGAHAARWSPPGPVRCSPSWSCSCHSSSPAAARRSSGSSGRAWWLCCCGLGAAQALAVGRVRSRLPRLDLEQMTRRAAPSSTGCSARRGACAKLRARVFARSSWSTRRADRPAW